MSRSLVLIGKRLNLLKNIEKFF